MTPSLSMTLAAALLVGQPSPDGDGSVTLPLVHWSAMLEAAVEPPPPVRPPTAVSYIERSLEGTFKKGLLRATLSARFEVFDDSGYIQVPLIDGDASPGQVRLNGEPTSLVLRDGMYTVGVEKPGLYEVVVDFYRGHEQDRFARRLQLAMPAGGVTRVSLLLPEPDIEARLAHGALSQQAREGDATRVVGFLDATGTLDLAWVRRLTHADATDARLEARVNTVVTVQDGLVSGLAVFDVSVLDGETDRLGLRLPDDMEVLAVTGEAVLQWRTVPSDKQRLEVLLRYLMRDETRVAVRFQYAVDAGAEALPIHTVLPPAGVAFEGALGVQAPAGFSVEVATLDAARTISLRELPEALTALTAKPLLFGFSFGAEPSIALRVTRQDQVELTSTLIDELQASTLLMANGLEITKMRLDIRNNTRQYLAVELPTGSQLTHALLDGQPVRPATSPETAKALLFSLRQSERIDPGGQRTHRVSYGQTLGSIAHIYYSDPEKWPLIREANRSELSGDAIQVGQMLVIPSSGELTVEESSFVLELAYKRLGHEPLGGVGRATLGLPSLDVDTMQVTWHLYLPDHLTPIDFSSNLTQYTAVRHGIFQRLENFIRRLLGPNDAYAGGGEKYQSILERRRGIYRDEAQKKSASEVAPASFPLVGNRYRFKRILADDDAPRITVVYLDDAALVLIRWLSLLAAFGLATLCLTRRSRWWRWLVAAAGMVALMVVAHYVLGVHRRLLWGVTLALAVAVWRVRGGRPNSERFWAALKEPWRLGELATSRNVVIGLGLYALVSAILAYPMLRWVTIACVLFVIWRRWRGAVIAAAMTLVVGFGALGFESNARAQVDPATANANFEALMNPQSTLVEAVKVDPVAPWNEAYEETSSAVAVPLPVFSELVAATRRAATRKTTKRLGPAVVLGAARYRGEAIRGALSLTVSLSLTLSRDDAWKTVPLVGEDAVLVSAKVGDEPIGIATQSGYHVWLTQDTGEVEVTMQLLVPARGPRGSIEYDFVAARTPVTHFECRFPVAGLEPRVDDAVQAEVDSGADATTLSATLRPTTRIHVVGFKDLGETDEVPSRRYAESLHLVSVDDGKLELFSVIRYTILYAGAKEFEILVPKGMEVISAEGEGAFRYDLEPREDGTLIRGQTAFPIRQGYEISVRLERETQKGGERFAVPLPVSQGVERDVGWVAIEVPGKMRLEEAARGEQMLPIDTRQLPPELVRSAVSPILKAYRYQTEGRELVLEVSRLPTHEIASEAVDRVRAFTVVSVEGTALTELRITMRNRLRHSLGLRLPPDSEVRSVLLDGMPAKPSRDASGQLMLPLKRSVGKANALEALTLQVVYETKAEVMGLVGRPALSLPKIALPVSTLAWSVFLPGDNFYGALRGEVDGQSLWGSARWREPNQVAEGDDADAAAADQTTLDVGASDVTDGGTMPVRISLPQAGTRLEYERYWIEPGQALSVSVSYGKRWLRFPLVLLLLLVVCVAGWLLGGRSRTGWQLALRGVGLSLGAAGLMGLVALELPLVVPVGVIAGLAAWTWRSRWLTRAWTAFSAWLSGLPAAWRSRESDAGEEADPRRLVRAGLLAVLAVTSILVLMRGLELVGDLLGPM